MRLNVTRSGQLVSTHDFSGDIVGHENSKWTFLIGRSEGCHVLLDEKQISREHADITFDNGEWILRKRSPIGILMVNGTPTSEKKLVNGDVLNIGSFAINVFIEDTQISKEDIPASNIKKLQDVSALEENIPPQGDIDDKVGELTTEFDMAGTLDDKNNDAIPQDDAFEDLSDDRKEDNEFVQDADDDSELNDIDDGDQTGDFALEESGEKTQVARSFVRFELELFGKYAPFDKFLIDSDKIFIGRDPKKCQIILNDPEVSSIHAVVERSTIICYVEDLNSANGTILNGSRIKKAELTNGDEFIIGDTTFTVKVVSELMKQEKDRLMPIEENQEIEVEEVVEVEADFSDTQAGLELSETGDNFGKVEVLKSKSLFSKDALKDPQKRKKILIGLIVLLALFLLLDEDEKKDKSKKSKSGKKQSYLLNPEVKKVKKDEKKKLKLTDEQKQQVESFYQLAKVKLDSGLYRDAIDDLDSVHNITKGQEWNNSKVLEKVAKDQLARLEEIEKEKQKRIEEAKRRERVDELVAEAKSAVKKRQAIVAEGFFAKIFELDPENIHVPILKMEIEAYQKEQERIALEEAQKKAERSRKIRQLKPGKTNYVRKEWFKAVLELEKFLDIKDMDEDLTQKASEMLLDSRKKLKEIVAPLIGKARSLKEGQDLKGAYEIYMKVIEFEPSNAEAIREMGGIRDTLTNRGKKIYREALISESLSLFDEAKEKFQEVQQISPSDSDYYKKATDKLRNYME